MCLSRCPKQCTSDWRNAYFWFQHFWVQQNWIEIWSVRNSKETRGVSLYFHTPFPLTILWHPGMIMFWNIIIIIKEMLLSWCFSSWFSIMILSNISFLFCSHTQEQCTRNASPLWKEPGVPIPACRWPGTVSHVSSMFSYWFDWIKPQ